MLSGGRTQDRYGQKHRQIMVLFLRQPANAEKQVQRWDVVIRVFWGKSGGNIMAVYITFGRYWITFYALDQMELN